MKKLFGFVAAILTFILLVKYILIPIGRTIIPQEIGVYESSNGNLIPIFSTWGETLIYFVWEIVAFVMIILFGIVSIIVYRKMSGKG